MIVLCTVAVMLSGGYRDYPQLRGIIVHDSGGEWMTVDFSEEFKKRGYKVNEQVITLEHESSNQPARLQTKLQVPVQRVKSNDCLYVNPPAEWLK